MGCGRFTISCRIKLGIFLKVPFIINILGFACHIFLLPAHQFHFAFIFVFQFSSVTQSCLTLCDPMNCSTPGLLVHHQLPEFTQIHVHRVGDATQPSHLLPSPSPRAPNPSQHQGLFQWVNSLCEVAKTLEFQLSIFVFTMVQICKNNL